MNVYDFDKTISNADCTASFIKYCSMRWPRVLLTLPGTAIYSIGMATGLVPKTRFKQYMYRFLRHIPDIEQAVEDFWNSNTCTIRQWYLDQQKPDDLVISASPEFLLRPICQKHGISNLICSQVNPLIGQYSGENCHGQAKVDKYIELYGPEAPDSFYSDSYNDEPMARFARFAYFVRGNTVTPWKFRSKEVKP